jgi:hypothetical protein
LRSGFPKVAVLAAASAGAHGYEIRRALAAAGLAVQEGTLYPLLHRLSTREFLDALKRSGKSQYQADGLSFDIDFGTRKWEASIDGAQFKAGMPPEKGAMRLVVLLGGSHISEQTLVLQKCTTELRFAE